MVRLVFVIGIGLVTVAFLSTGGVRGLLWPAIQACVINQSLTGSPFPCLDVEYPNGRGSGYVVFRSWHDERHVIVVPTARLVGIEEHRLLEADTPSYLDNAWRSRRFVLPDPPAAPTDFGLAINSKFGRTQDQLHIHVDCIRSDLKRSLQTAGLSIPVGHWVLLRLKGAGAPYWMTILPGPNLAETNVFALARSGLNVAEPNMQDLSFAIFPTSDDVLKPRFVVLARLRQIGRTDAGHAEFLLNHDCLTHR